MLIVPNAVVQRSALILGIDVPAVEQFGVVDAPAVRDTTLIEMVTWEHGKGWISNFPYKALFSVFLTKKLIFKGILIAK